MSQSAIDRENYNEIILSNAQKKTEACAITPGATGLIILKRMET